MFSQNPGANITRLDVSGLQHVVNSCQYAELQISDKFPVEVDSGTYKNGTDLADNQQFSSTKITTVSDGWTMTNSIQFGVSVQFGLPQVAGVSASMTMSVWIQTGLVLIFETTG